MYEQYIHLQWHERETITNDERVANKLRKLKDFGRSSCGLDLHDTIGYNSDYLSTGILSICATSLGNTVNLFNGSYV